MERDIIILIVLMGLSVPFGTYIIIKTVNKCVRVPVNTLTRSGDIELVDYIEPTRPQQIYNYQDLLEQQLPINYYERAPSYFSGTPPSYQTVDRINSVLENNINLFDILIAFILGVLFFFLIKYLSKTNSRTIFTNGISTEVITFINNYQEILSSKLNKGDRGYFLNSGEIQSKILKYGWSEEDIKSWLESLEEQDYIVTIEILSDSSCKWRMISKEFMVNYNSDYFLITLLINDQLLNLYKSIDIDTNHIVIIYYAPLTKSDFSESYFIKRDRR